MIAYVDGLVRLLPFFSSEVSTKERCMKRRLSMPNMISK